MSTETSRAVRSRRSGKNGLRILAAGMALGAFILGFKMFLAPEPGRAYHWTRGGASHGEAQAASTPVLSEEDFLSLLRKVHDPELNTSIVDLGLIYKTEIGGSGNLHLTMTLTSPSCPYGGTLIANVKEALFSHPGVQDVELRLTFDPPWSIDRISPAARARLLGTVPPHIRGKESS